jgi:hypothetical protein
MSPGEKNILDTVNLLVLIFRTQKSISDLSPEKRHTLRITNEHLNIAGLTIPVFHNTLQELNAKGYIFALTVFEQKYQPEILKFLDEAEYKRISDKLRATDTTELDNVLKQASLQILKEHLPANIHVSEEDLSAEDVSTASLLDYAREGLKGYSPDIISIVVLSPFRSIEQLLFKLNSGTPFTEIKDAGVWYDPDGYEFHFDDTSVSTAYQGKPNKEHFALMALFGQFEENRIDYTDIPEINSDHVDSEKKSYRDALNRFIEKHPRLSEIFSVHADHLAIHERYLEHSH